jgi:NAD(P)-dependent dehydrogenase (short-subunit alcohol dehydrogenase family)
MNVQDKVTLITGASDGIGLVTARRFAQGGAKLALMARSADKLEALAEELRGQGHEAISVPTDVIDPAQVHRAIADIIRHYGRIDVLINNAGQAAVGKVAELDIDDFRSIIEVNLLGAFTMMQTVIPIMRSQGGGLIINISTMVSKMNIPSLAAYAASKAGLNALSGTARVELAPDNIRVVTVFPRMTRTDFPKHSLGDTEFHKRVHDNPNIPIDEPELVAEKIFEAAITEPEEQYVVEPKGE